VDREWLDTLVGTLGLGQRLTHRPAELSGGQQQRVALARALVNRPRALLLDEPLGALDLKLRQAMQVELKRIQREVGITFVYVTHDQNEALTMSDRIAVFNRGIIEQIGSPRDIYDHPRTRFVAEFIGETNLLEGTVKGHDPEGTTIELDSRRHLTVPRTDAFAAGARVLVSVRPERILLGPSSLAVQNMLPTRVLDSVYQGDHLRVQLDEAAFRLVARLDRRSAEWPDGADVVAHFAPQDCWVVAA
jgi:putative spermidine/putrescine transport system ATP-binding protein